MTEPTSAAPAPTTDPRTPIHRLWPAPDGTPLDDDALAALYGRPEQPHLRVNFVSSIDGAVAVNGFSAGLSNGPDKRVFGVLRMLCDALVVGAGTLRQENYGPVRLDERRRAWRRAHGMSEYPTLVVVSGALDLDPRQAAFAQAPVRPVVLTHARSTAPAGLASVADLIRVSADTADPFTRFEESSEIGLVNQVGLVDQNDRIDLVDRVDLTAGLAELHRRGHRQLLCEGGPYLFGALTTADLVDEVCLTVAPLLAGAGAGRITAGTPSPPRGMGLRHLLAAESTLLLRYARD
ncbi:pyrimidine reductase family protein [Micromonospora sp. NPDC049523]|uniref:pyrimidine reductase family protein n=1 Tax=Micromonospora sp. NPDC049523 TaxID=3155921 RepID=UPI0034329518